MCSLARSGEEERVSKYVKRYQTLKYLLAHKGRLNQSRIARDLKCDKAIMSKDVIHQLVAAGLVEERPRGREKLYTLTPEGETITTLLKAAENALPEPYHETHFRFSGKRGYECESIRVSEKPNTMINLFVNNVVRPLGVDVDTRKDRHAKDALERIGSQELLDAMIIPEFLALQQNRAYCERIDPDNNLKKTTIVCGMGHSKLSLVEVKPVKSRKKFDARIEELHMLGGAAVEEYIATEYFEGKTDVNRHENPEEPVKVVLESMEEERPVQIIVKPPLNMLFFLLRLWTSEFSIRIAEIEDVLEKYGHTGGIKDYIIVRKDFAEEHPQVVAEIDARAYEHYKRLENDREYRIYCQLAQVDLLVDLIPKSCCRLFKEEIESVRNAYKNLKDEVKDVLLSKRLSRAVP